MTIDPESIPNHAIIKTKSDIEKLIQMQKSISDPINEGLNSIRKNVKKGGGKKYRKKINTIYSWKKFISETVLIYSRQFLGKEYKIDLSDPSWSQLDFLLLTFEEYFLSLEISGNRKFDKNDWGDLLNLAYVQPEKKYWTFEKKWNNIFKENETLSKYIFNKNAT